MSKEIIFDTMKKAGSPMKAGDIVTASGLDKNEVDKAIKTLLAEELIHSPKRCFYEPK